MKKECSIKLGDWWLLAIFFVLVAQSAYGLFVPSQAPTQVLSADIVFRTSIAAIFGYVISTNFGRKGEKQTVTKTDPSGGATIGFSSPNPESPTATAPGNGKREVTQEPAPVAKTGNSVKKTHKSLSDSAQLSIVGIIGLISLAVLIYWRNSVTSAMAVDNSVTSVLSQFRDMISGCVGFLIGHPQEKSSS